MTDGTEVQPTKQRSAPEVVAPTSKVNVALPFSHLHVEESSKDLGELSGIVADLAGIVEEANPGPKVKRVRERAQVLRRRLQ